MLKKVSGTRDILPQDINLWHSLEELSRTTFSLYGYKEIRTPIIEELGLFNRSLGDSTEIVQKQMFAIRRKKDTYVLRPEATASIARAYLENNLNKQQDLSKFYYIGPMFRAERPQKGRLRQFHHIGGEAIGSLNPYLDAEVISLANQLLQDMSISGYEIKINSLGCLEDKKKLSKILKEDLKDKILKLCDECKDRYKRNVFRILDCKNDSCCKIKEALKISDKYLCSDCLMHFNKVKINLDNLKVKYKVVPYLVRGLDYYTRTVFEIVHPNLGAQDALGAGGRYDNLIKLLGGPDIPAIGFALGIERLILVTNTKSLIGNSTRSLTYIITLGKQAQQLGFMLLDKLRKNSIEAEMDYQEKSLKAQMRQADSKLSRFVVIIGEDELKKDVVGLKDMVSGEQKEIGLADLVSYLKGNLT